MSTNNNTPKKKVFLPIVEIGEKYNKLQIEARNLVMALFEENDREEFYIDVTKASKQIWFPYNDSTYNQCSKGMLTAVKYVSKMLVLELSVSESDDCSNGTSVDVNEKTDPEFFQIPALVKLYRVLIETINSKQ